MPAFIDRTGRKYGNLKVIRRVKRPDHVKTKLVYWECVCEDTISGSRCGKILSVSSLNFWRSDTVSCYPCGRIRASRKLRGKVSSQLKYPAGYSVIYNDYRAKYPDLELTKDQFLLLTQQPCYYCDRSFVNSRLIQGRKGSGWKAKDQYFLYNGIDRFDNSKGHTLDNSVPCCGPCNVAKGNRSVEEFLEWIRVVAQHSLSPHLLPKAA